MLEPTDRSPAGALPLLRPLLLRPCNEGWVALPAEAERSPSRGFAPFPLPPPPRAFLDWLVVAGRGFWQRRGRCVAALLLVDCGPGHDWTIRLPRQCCGPDAVNWTLDATDFADLPSSFRVGGSFQTLADPDAAPEAVPPHEGFHFVMGVDASLPVWNYVRDADGLRPVPPTLLLASDQHDAIEQALSRLQFA